MRVISSDVTYERTVDVIDYARRIIFDMPQSQAPVFTIRTQRLRFEYDDVNSEIINDPAAYEFVNSSDQDSFLDRTATIDVTIDEQTATDNDSTAVLSMAHVLAALESMLDEIALEVNPA
jgi:hypothetical protein